MAKSILNSGPAKAMARRWPTGAAEKDLLFYELKEDGLDLLVDIENELVYNYDDADGDEDDDDFFS